MVVDVDRLRRHVERVRESDDVRAVARRAVDRFHELADVSEPSAADLEPIVEAARFNAVLPNSVGTELLLSLAARCHAGLDAVLGIAAHGDATQRLRLLSTLDHRVPVDLATELVRFGVHDGSTRVRVKAAEKIAHLELDLVDELRAQVARERHRIARTNLERYLAVATVGYAVEHGDDGHVHVWYCTPSGWAGFELSAEETAAGLLPDRLAEARARFEPRDAPNGLPTDGPDR